MDDVFLPEDHERKPLEFFGIWKAEAAFPVNKRELLRSLVHFNYVSPKGHDNSLEILGRS